MCKSDLENKWPTVTTAPHILNAPLQHHFNPSHDRHPYSQHHLDAAVRLRTHLAPDTQALHHQCLAHPPCYQCLQFK